MLRPGVTKNSDIFLRKAKVFVSSGIRKGTFDEHTSDPNTFQVSSVHSFDDVGDYYLKTFIRYDELNVRIIRHEYTWLLWLAMLGGIQGAFGSYFRRIAIAVSRRIFMDKVL